MVEEIQHAVFYGFSLSTQSFQHAVLNCFQHKVQAFPIILNTLISSC